MTRRRRPKSVRKARALALSREERAYSKDPHSFIFARPGVGSLVKQLSLDLRGIFEPFTASRLKPSRRNVLKDFITVAGPLHVTHILYLTHPHVEKREEKRQRQLAKHSHQLDGAAPGGDDEQQCALTDSSIKTTSTAEKTKGGVYLHLVRVPHGPSLTFAVCEYSLQKDVLTVVRRIFDSHQFSTPPLLAMTGFGSLMPDAPAPRQPQPPPPHLRLIVDMFQNMLPPLNVQKLKLNTVRRVLLISREVDISTVDEEDSSSKPKNPDDLIYIRHYHIRTENRGISRALRRLSVGGVHAKKRRLATVPLDESVPKALIAPGLGPGGSGRSSGVPNLAKYTCMEDFLTKTGMLSDSALSDALSDIEEVDLPQGAKLPNPVFPNASKKRKFTPSHGLKHLGTAKRATVRLTEIGPRLTLKLIKVEEGVNSGTVLYHRWQSRSLVQVAEQAERLREREALRAKRRAEHEAHRIANEEAREAHRAACLEGMRRAGQLVSDKADSVKNAGESDESSEEEANEIKSALVTNNPKEGTVSQSAKAKAGSPKVYASKFKKSVVGSPKRLKKKKKVTFQT
ncbi:unnamed protein product [Calicophoron daubneyi]|uniref:Brix domain-containing protein n=1 Tax=Calicophoron daubneyi TaxID=300641 RepID=A0AAV2TXX4_CALDB